MTMASNNWAFIISAYVAAWLVVAGYWMFVHGALRRARARYEQSFAEAARAEGRSQ
jgi:hypothetical protein